MRFWDSSALVPLAFAEPRSESVQALLRDDGVIAVWWGTPVECASVAGRLRRERRLDRRGETDAIRVLDRLRASWLEIEPSEALRHGAMRLLRVHPLRAGDALQLAAALVWAGTGTGLGFVTLDPRLADAARAEGFDVVMPAPPDPSHHGRPPTS